MRKSQAALPMIQLKCLIQSLAELLCSFISLLLFSEKSCGLSSQKLQLSYKAQYPFALQNMTVFKVCAFDNFKYIY